MLLITAIITETSGIQAHKYVQNKQKVRILQRSWKENRSPSDLKSMQFCLLKYLTLRSHDSN